MTRPPLRSRMLVAAALTLAAATAAHADDAPAPASGRLTIHAAQGTAGAPPIGSCDAELELRHNGAILATRTITLDADGNAIVEGLPIEAGVLPVVKIRYADAFYLQSGKAMDPSNADQEITVTCYQTTTQEPAWHVAMRHVMLVGDPHGVRVTEVVQLHSDSDKTWLGVTHAGSDPITTSFSIPAQAVNVQLLQGFAGWENTSRMGETLYNHLPLMPGDTEMTLSYAIPWQQSATPLFFAAPVPVLHAMVIVPDTLTVSDTTNLEAGGGTRIADTDVHFFMAQNLPPGAAIGINVAATGAQAGPAQANAMGNTPPTTPADSGAMMKWIAAGAGGLILVAAALILLRRPGTN